MGQDDTVVLRMVTGVNYIGRGYHFQKNDTAEMTREEAVPFLKLKAAGAPRFVIVDPEMEKLLVEGVGEGSGDMTGKDLKGKVVEVDPETITEPRVLREWLTSHGIAVAKNASMPTMQKLIPTLEKDEGVEEIVIK